MELYKILEERRAALTSEDTDALGLKSYLGALDIAIEDKVADCIAVARELEYEARAASEEASRLSKLSGNKERRARNLRRYALEALQEAGIPAVKHPFFSIRVVQNPPACQVHDEDGFIAWARQNAREDLLVPPEPGEWEVSRDAVLRALKNDPASIPEALATTTRGVRLDVR